MSALTTPNEGWFGGGEVQVAAPAPVPAPADGLTVPEALELAGTDAAQLAERLRQRGDKVLAPSLWPSKHTRRVRWLRWRWWVADPAVTNTLADGYALTEKWAWHKAGVAAARVHNERDEAAKRKAESTPHPFFARCEHGVQFLDECEACPDGCPVVPEAGAERAASRRAES